MPPAGILLLDKPPGPTSHDAVNAVRRALGTRRVGHLGTLDPFASGLLVCAVGVATRLAPSAGGHDRRYRAGVRLGWRSTTDDPQGELSEVGAAVPPSMEAVEQACQRWVGEVAQVPPVYSAKHVAGKRAYALARAGCEVLLPAVEIRIDAIGIERYRYPDLELTVTCGPGTYIRSLARDLGEELETGAYCAALRRERTGPFSVADGLSWEMLGGPGAARQALRPAEAIVAGLPAAELNDAAVAAVVAGRRLAWLESPAAGWVRLRGPGGFVGLAEVDGAGWLQPRRILFPDGEDSQS